MIYNINFNESMVNRMILKTINNIDAADGDDNDDNDEDETNDKVDNLNFKAIMTMVIIDLWRQ